MTYKSEEQRQKKIEYMRQWRQEHKEHCREYKRKYTSEHREELNQYYRDYRAKKKAEKMAAENSDHFEPTESEEQKND